VPIKWTDLAVADLEKTEDTISLENNPGVAIDVVLKIFDTVDLVLPGHPRGGPEGRVSGTRELVVDSVPFTVVYRESNSNEPQVLRILHDTQQWPPAI